MSPSDSDSVDSRIGREFGYLRRSARLQDRDTELEASAEIEAHKPALEDRIPMPDQVPEPMSELSSEPVPGTSQDSRNSSTVLSRQNRSAGRQRSRSP